MGSKDDEKTLGLESGVRMPHFDTRSGVGTAHGLLPKPQIDQLMSVINQDPQRVVKVPGAKLAPLVVPDLKVGEGKGAPTTVQQTIVRRTDLSKVQKPAIRSTVSAPAWPASYVPLVQKPATADSQVTPKSSEIVDELGQLVDKIELLIKKVANVPPTQEQRSSLLALKRRIHLSAKNLKVRKVRVSTGTSIQKPTTGSTQPEELFNDGVVSVFTSSDLSSRYVVLCKSERMVLARSLGELLILLLRNPHQAFTVKDFADRMDIKINNAQQRIFTLRKSLAALPALSRSIVKAPRCGYVFNKDLLG